MKVLHIIFFTTNLESFRSNSTFNLGNKKLGIQVGEKKKQKLKRKRLNLSSKIGDFGFD